MKSTRFGKRSRQWVLSLLLPAFAFSGQPLRAIPQVSLPTGGQVIHGQAFINQISANHLRIDQSSQNAIINWTDFSIAQGNLTQFAQPNASASVLNRVTGGNVSHIHGMLQGNGNVFVINPNGIVIGASGVVDVGGMAVLSTLDIDDQDFLDGGPSRFYGDSTTGVSNFGTITSAGGDVVLLGGFVNNEGQIGAMNGTVALGSGGDILLEQSNGAQITVRGASDYDGRPGVDNKTGAGINNAGEIGGAAVEMKAHGNVYALAINNTGMVRASGATRANGRVRLQAGGGSSNINLGNTSQLYARNGADGGEIRVESVGGNVTNAGAIDASGAVDGGTVEVVGNTVTTAASSVVSATGVDEGGMIQIDAVAATTVSGLVDASSSFGTGGRIEITGAEVELTGVTEVTVDGGQQGGGLRIGGEFQGRDDFGIREADFTTIGGEVILTADSRFGDAGSVIVWANEDTMYLGEASASALGPMGDGGLIEISGKERLAMRGHVAATSVNGASGTVLFDPGTLTVGYFNGASTDFNEIEIADLNRILQGGTSVVLMTSGIGSDVIFEDVDLALSQGGGAQFGGTIDGGLFAYDDPNHPRNLSVQWTNSDASLGVFAGGDIEIRNHIRTSGGGSINLLAGWTGLEGDPIFASYSLEDPNKNLFIEFGQKIAGPEAIFRSYLSAGAFGQNGGSISVGDRLLDRHVEVGSRYGNTNLAGDFIRVTASDFNAESLHAQVGFRDSGTVFAARFNQTGAAYDLNLPGFRPADSPAADNPMVGIIFENEVDVNGDGVYDGVAAVNSTGVVAGSFIPYANHYNSSRVGNWWWQQIHGESVARSRYNGAATDKGGNRPEMGAGAIDNYANINVIATGNVEVSGGGRSHSAAQIGHGGDSAGGLEDVSERNAATITNNTGSYVRAWTTNGSRQDRSSVSIARLAPVYGNINVLAGVNAAAGVTQNFLAGTLTATVDDAGSVILKGLERVSSSNNIGNLETNSASRGAPAFIGHGGVGQFGRFIGDIHVEADGDIEVRAGSNSRGFSSIGHQMNTYNFWNPTSEANAQIRFFRDVTDFDKPELRRGALFAGGPVPVAALDGSTINEFRGDITVRANDGEVLVKGFDTPDLRGSTAHPTGLLTYRDNRYAMIGHGGSLAEEQQDRSIFSGAANTGGNNFEQVRLRITNTDSRSESVAGTTAGSAVNRSLTFFTISGDIDVESSGDVKVSAGNSSIDFAMIGHGGAALADVETSSAIVGDIKLNAGGQLRILGGGEEFFTGVRRDTQAGGRNHDPFGRNFAMVGHGGYRTGFNGFMGDIRVSTVGDITLEGGEFRDAYAKIGHQGRADWGQSGGDYVRNENFLYDGVSTDIETRVIGNKLTVSFSNYTDLDIDISGNTANVSVTSTEGNILLDHKGEGLEKNANQILSDADPNFATRQGNALVNQVYVQIGHGGIDTDSVNRNNPNYRFFDKVGDVEVTAVQGDIRLNNGNGEDRWTRIGHGLGRGDFGNVGGESLILAGDITVTAGGSIFVDASAADANGNIGNLLYTNADVGRASSWNPVAIGHGGVQDGDGIVVLSDGELVNGIAASSNIVVSAGWDLEVLGGKGLIASRAQVGHGYGSTIGNANTNRVGGQASGFNGDITVEVGRNLRVEGGSNAFVYEQLNLSSDAVSVQGAYAAIGNGGYAIDAEANGNISVFVGGNAQIRGQQRADTISNTTASSAAPNRRYTPDSLLGSGGNVASMGNFASVGHFNFENELIGGAVLNADQSGNVTVVVNGNLDLTGGTTADAAGAPISGAYARIGNGGPGIGGNIEGDVTVLVKGNLNVTGGTERTGNGEGLNNYAQIGNGDRLIAPSFVAPGEALGRRDGNIVVAVGGSANFDRALVGHSDPATSLQSTSGETTVAVSRNNPFFGGGGTLTSTGSVFSSGSGGAERLEFYMPARSSNRINNTTRINEATAAYLSGTPGNFVGLDGSGSETSGRADEVYLTPDLWWDAAGLGKANGFNGGGVFPTDAVSGQGGALAAVNTPGGFPNLKALSAGALGSSASTYRQGNRVNGAGRYTFYYDAVEPVTAPSFPQPPPPVPPVPPVFDPLPFFDFLFGEQFYSFSRNQESSNNGLTGVGSGIYGALGRLFEVNENESEGAGATRLDNLFGARRSSSSEEGLTEEEVARRRSEAGVGSTGLTFSVFDPGTNRYSSYEVFGTAFDLFYPVN